MNETNLQAKIRLHAAENQVLLFRNNSGAVMVDGQMVRYGLANDSPKINAVLKSADLVGLKRHVVTQSDVGQTLGIFTSVEVKHPGWRMMHTPHETAQAAWGDLVRSWGGHAGFAWDMASARAIWGDT